MLSDCKRRDGQVPAGVTMGVHDAAASAPFEVVVHM